MEQTQDWLNDEFVSSILKASIDDITSITFDSNNAIHEGARVTRGREIIVVGYNAKRALEDGKNYSSLIYKVQVEYKESTDEIKKEFFIVKKLNNLAAAFVGDKEKQVYKTLPIIEQYIKSRIAPKLYMCNELEMVMEDLTEQGFQNSAVQILDYEHCELALTKLAKFHAGSLLLHQKDSKLIEEKAGYEVITSDSVSDKIAYFQDFVSNLRNEISTWPESANYTKYFHNICKQIRSYYDSLIKRSTLRVLNHGDFWLNNMMFKYNKGKVCDVRFVDFQLSRFTSPTCDIQYFIGSTANLDVRLNRLDELYSVYLDTFNATLAQIGVSRNLTKKEFEENLQEDYKMYFIGLAGPLCVVLAEEESAAFRLDDLDMDTAHELSGRFSKLLRNKKYRKFVSIVLDDLDKKGVFQRFA